MKEIGGYFELELNSLSEFHEKAIKLNLGRTAFEYILRAKKVQKVFLPYYACEVILETIRKAGAEHEFYHIDKSLEPIFDYSKKRSEDYFLYINYFGLKDRFIDSLVKKISNLIIDNSQAFFAKPIPGIDTFYSPRKFFGVPDGGYLYTDIINEDNYEIDNSLNRLTHLLARIEEGVEEAYSLFRKNESLLSKQPIKTMSYITSRLLQSIDYETVRKKRKDNFAILHNILASKNLLDYGMDNDKTPMVYPFMTQRMDIHEVLIKKNIYVARYWVDVLNRVSSDSIESNFVKYLLPLPIDQRYRKEDMKYIANIILQNV